MRQAQAIGQATNRDQRSAAHGIGVAGVGVQGTGVAGVGTAAPAERAMSAWRASRRRRLAAGALQSAGDAIVALAGLLLANAALRLDLGLPEGRAGLAVGATLLCIGAAWMARARSHRGGTDPAGQQRALVIRLDREIALDRTIDLDQLERRRAA